MYLTPPRLSLAANNITIAITQVTGARGRTDTSASSRSGDFTPARNVECGCHFSLHSLELFQISEPRRLSAIIPREWLLGKEAIWVEALGCWESLDPKKCHYQDEKIVSPGRAQNLRQDAEAQETDWWYFATKVYPIQNNWHTKQSSF